MMKRLKMFCVSLFISCLLVPCICCSLVVSAIDPAIIIETAVAAIELTVATADALDDGYQEQHKENVKAVFGALDNQLGNSSVSILNYCYIVGKCQSRYLCQDNIERSYNIEVSMYYLENSNSVQYSDVSTAPKVRGKDGRDYLANNIYFDIYYSDGVHYRIRYKADDYMSLNSTLNYNAFPSNGDLLLRLIRPNNGRFFDVTDGSLFGRELTNWGNSSTYINLYYEPKNTVVFTPEGAYYTNQSNKYRFDDTTTDSEITPTRNMSLGYFPTPYQICFNNLKYTIFYSSGSSGYTGRSPYYVCAFVDTNNSALNNSYNYMNADKKKCFNFYYDNTVTGGTTIDNSNKTTVLGGVLAPNFDANGLFTAIGNLDATLKPLLDISLPDINSLVTDFFSDMPDFNLPWNDRNPDNNYFDLPWDDLVPDNPDNNITVIVTVDVSRPLVPEFTTSSRWLYVDVGNLTTTVQAIQPEYVAAAHTLQDKTDSIFEQIGVLPLYLGLAIFGVAVSVLFKGV